MIQVMQRLVVAAGLVTVAGWSFAQVTNVNTGLTYTTIGAAVTAASPGHTIQIGAGTFNENVVVNKWITLDGAGDSTVIAPATGAPLLVTAGGTGIANRSVIRDLRIESGDSGIPGAVAVRGDVGDLTFDNLTVNWLGGQAWTPQVEGFSFRNAAGAITDWVVGSASNHNRISILNSRIRNFYVATIFYENATDIRFENNQVQGGWYGFQRLNFNQNGPASVSNRSTDTITLRRNTFFDQGVKGVYLEAGNNVTLESNQFLFNGNRSGDSLPTSDPRGLAGARSGNGVDLNYNNCGEQQNVRIINNVFVGNATRDRIPGDPGGPDLGIGSALAIKGRMFRGGTFINGLDITGNTFSGNKIGIAFPEVDVARTSPVAAVPGVNAGNRVVNARIVANNFFGNRVRGINGEGAAAGTGNLVFATPQNVAIMAGGPNITTPTTWNSLAFGTAGILVSDNFYGASNGFARMAAVLSPALPPAGSGDAISPGIVDAPFLASRLATPLGRPVDLAGSYTAPSSVFTSLVAADAVGVASATTGIAGLITSQVTEVSGGLGPAFIGTFTPFNSTPKLPRLASIPAASANGATINAVVSLGGEWSTWRWGGSYSATFATGDTFSVGIGNQWQTMGVQFVRDHISGHFRARMASVNLAPRNGISDGTANIGALAGNEGVAFGAPAANTSTAGFAGATRFMVSMIVGVNSMRGFVTPLNGSNAGQAVDLGTISKTNMNTNSPWTPFTNVNSFFVAGFNTYMNRRSEAEAAIESFTTTVGDNAHYSWADDAYVQGSERIQYRVGMANLIGKTYGYQGSYISSGDQGGPFTFQNLIYPFNFPLTNPTIGSLQYAAGMQVNPINLDGTDVDLPVASMSFAPTVATNGLAWVTPQNTFLGALAAYYSDFDGNPIGSPAMIQSNQVVVDSTLPNVNPVSLTFLPPLAPPISVPFGPGSPNIAAGPFQLVVSSFDGGSVPSGLATRPTYEWDFGNNGSVDVSGRMQSGTGSNFIADFTIPDTATLGPAKLTICATDRAGNQTCFVRTFTLAQSLITINLNLQGTVPSWAVSRTLRARIVNPSVVSPWVSFNVSASTASVSLPVWNIYSGPATVEVDGAQFMLRKTPVTLTGLSQSLGPVTVLNGDIDNDGQVDLTDIDLAIADYLTPGGSIEGDITDVNNDGEVDLTDIDIVIANYLLTDD